MELVARVSRVGVGVSVRGGVAVFCNYIVFLFVVVPLYIVSRIILFFQVFISCTGGQSVSHVLLWQPSDCLHSMVMIVLCCSRKINMMMMIGPCLGLGLATGRCRWLIRPIANGRWVGGVTVGYYCDRVKARSVILHRGTIYHNLCNNFLTRKLSNARLYSCILFVFVIFFLYFSISM